MLIREEEEEAGIRSPCVQLTLFFTMPRFTQWSNSYFSFFFFFFFPPPHDSLLSLDMATTAVVAPADRTNGPTTTFAQPNDTTQHVRNNNNGQHIYSHTCTSHERL